MTERSKNNAGDIRSYTDYLERYFPKREREDMVLLNTPEEFGRLLATESMKILQEALSVRAGQA